MVDAGDVNATLGGVTGHDEESSIGPPVTLPNNTSEPPPKKRKSSKEPKKIKVLNKEKLTKSNKSMSHLYYTDDNFNDEESSSGSESSAGNTPSAGEASFKGRGNIHYDTSSHRAVTTSRNSRDLRGFHVNVASNASFTDNQI